MLLSPRELRTRGTPPLFVEPIDDNETAEIERCWGKEDVEPMRDKDPSLGLIPVAAIGPVEPGAARMLACVFVTFPLPVAAASGLEAADDGSEMPEAACILKPPPLKPDTRRFEERPGTAAALPPLAAAFRSRDSSERFDVPLAA
jgi:hypothetical protein